MLYYLFCCLLLGVIRCPCSVKECSGCPEPSLWSPQQILVCSYAFHRSARRHCLACILAMPDAQFLSWAVHWNREISRVAVCCRILLISPDLAVDSFTCCEVPPHPVHSPYPGLGGGNASPPWVGTCWNMLELAIWRVGVCRSWAGVYEDAGWGGWGGFNTFGSSLTPNWSQPVFFLSSLSLLCTVCWSYVEALFHCCVLKVTRAWVCNSCPASGRWWEARTAYCSQFIFQPDRWKNIDFDRFCYSWSCQTGSSPKKTSAVHSRVMSIHLDVARPGMRCRLRSAR